MKTLKSKRTGRMAELIQSVIARLLLKDVRDPRMSSATITGVDLAPDFGSVTVFFTLLDATPNAIKIAEKTFEKANGYFRVQLSQLTELRYTPKITFKYDTSVMHAEHISRLLDAV
jgi:ribosome-binding factor A